MVRSLARILALLAGTAVGCGGGASSPPAGDPPLAPKVYVAVERTQAIAVLDEATLAPLRTIDTGVATMPHNVAVAPDRRTVWATVPSDMSIPGGDMMDRVLVIDPRTDAIVARIEVGEMVHPAHVVVAPGGRFAYVTLMMTNELVKIDTTSYAVVDRIALGSAKTPHGLRISADGTRAFIAKIDGQCVETVDLAAGTSSRVYLPGSSYQLAVAKDERTLFASVYDSKRVARIDTETEEPTYTDLPDGAEGPIQVDLTDDGATLLVADQGLLLGRASSDRLYFYDVATAAFTGSVSIAAGAHGVVVAGPRAFVTAYEAGSVSAVDVAERRVLATTPVGAHAAGVAVWTPP